MNLTADINNLIKWFQIEFSELSVEMQESNHHYDTEEHLNPYHIEGNIFTHTMMVCKVAEIFSMKNNYVKWSALLHDIGKPASRELVYIENEENDLSDKDFLNKYSHYIDEYKLSKNKK